MSDWVTFLPFLAAVIGVAVSGARFKPGAWYGTLDKPSWTPPSWLFAPAWTTLYLMIAIAGWMVWRSGGPAWLLVLWGANLLFNAAWSWLMFGRHRIGLALLDSLAMLVTIVGFIAATWSVSRAAALLFVPYLGWVAFATALNWSILRCNLSSPR